MLREHIVASWWIILSVCLIIRLWANYVADILTTWERPEAKAASTCGVCVNFVILVTLISRIVATL